MMPLRKHVINCAINKFTISGGAPLISLLKSRQKKMINSKSEAAPTPALALAQWNRLTAAKRHDINNNKKRAGKSCKKKKKLI